MSTKRPIIIAHAKDEDDLAEKLAAPLREHGYEPLHFGTLFIGDGLIAEASKLLAEGAPVVLCASSKAIGTRWARQLSNAARTSGIKVFGMQMDEDADIELITFDERYGRYWQSSEIAIKQLIEALTRYYPLVEQSAPALSIKLGIARYYAELRKRYQRLDLDSLTPRQRTEYMEVLLRSVYVEQTVRENPPPIEFPKEVIDRLRLNMDIEQIELPEDLPLEEVKRVSDVYYRKPPVPILEILAQPDSQHTVILGDPGAGKSTLTRYIILSMIEESPDNIFTQTFAGYLPLLIELKSYIGLFPIESNKNFLDYFEHLRETEGHYLEKNNLHQYLTETGNAILIFDGLDEIFEPDERDNIARRIDNFKETYPKVRVIVTSRIVGFRRRILTEAGFRIYTLQDLDEPRIRQFTEKWYAIALIDKPDQAKERTKLIMQAIIDSDSIRQLAGNPLLLTIMAILARNQELPRERWKLYDQAVSVLLEIWDVNKYLREKEQPAQYIDEDDKREMLQGIAFKMQSGEAGSAGNYITDRDLQHEFEAYIGDRYKESLLNSGRIARNMIQQLHERNFILSLYGAKLYGFVHRAFLEYFCALSIVRDFQNSRKLSIDQLKKEIFNKYGNDPAWHEVLQIVAGMIEADFAGEVIKELASIPELVQFIKYSSFITPSASKLSLSLAIKCLAEVKKIYLLADAGKILLEAICDLFDSDMISNPFLYSFFKLEILPYAKMIGASWPGNEYLATLLQQRRHSQIADKRNYRFNFAYIYDNLFGSFIGHIGKGSTEVHFELMSYSFSQDATLRVSVPFALATGWHDDPETFPLLCDMANEDKHRTVSYAALYALAEHYHDNPETFPLLKRNATSSPHAFGRAAAITGLASHYTLQPGVFALIKNAAFHEKDKFPRTVAIKSLGEYFTNEPETFTMLLQAAKNDDSPQPHEKEYEEPYYVRDAAITALFRHWPDRHETHELLHDRALFDPTPWLQAKAESMFIQLAKR